MMMIIIIIIIIIIPLTVRKNMVLGCYSGIDLMLRNIATELWRIFVVTAMTVGLWFE